nr:hypothetical protein [Streptomyces sp. MH191]
MRLSASRTISPSRTANPKPIPRVPCLVTGLPRPSTGRPRRSVTATSYQTSSRWACEPSVVRVSTWFTVWFCCPYWTRLPQDVRKKTRPQTLYGCFAGPSGTDGSREVEVLFTAVRPVVAVVRCMVSTLTGLA